ncbi:MAG TPA: hypothetical protein PLN69_10445 [bacterium]|nr:hypothetical protein [bacterium]
MALHVVGMTLDDAVELIDSSGLKIESIEYASTPADSNKKFQTTGYDSTRVATCWEHNGNLRLRVVSVPSGPISSNI